MVKTPCFQSRGRRFHPWLGKEDPVRQEVRPGKKRYVISIISIGVKSITGGRGGGGGRRADKWINCEWWPLTVQRAEVDRRRVFLLTTLTLGEPRGRKFGPAVLGAGMGGGGRRQAHAVQCFRNASKFPPGSTSLLLSFSEGTHRSFFQHVLWLQRLVIEGSTS